MTVSVNDVIDSSIMNLFSVIETSNSDCDDDIDVVIQLDDWRDGEIENTDDENEVDRSHDNE